jgi:ribosomal protein L16 Arg81 hydroxylase
MPAKSIERICMTDRETFFRNYIYRRRPVIITDLFKGQKIRQINLPEDARTVFGNVKLRIQTEYASSLHSSESVIDQTMTFSDYWDFVQEHPSTNLLCTEYEIPARVMVLFKLPDICLASDIGEPELLSLPRKYGDHDLFSNVFLANKGNKAHLHYDGDQRQVLLYQVFGNKRFILFEPESGINLKPLDVTPWFSGMFLEHMTNEEKDALIDSANGYDATIGPGEAIYIPMLMWHYVEYKDSAMSFNLRFGRNRYGRFLCVDNFHRDYYIQNFASHLADKAACESKYKHSITSIITEYEKPAIAMLDKIKTMRGLFKQLCEETCPESRAKDYCPSDREGAELQKILKDSESTARYADPNTVALIRPVGPISVLQKRQIEENAVARGYTADVLHRLLWNRLGKKQVDALTKAEAAQFVSYMRSSGAWW